MRFWRLSKLATGPIFQRTLTRKQQNALEQIWSSVLTTETAPSSEDDDNDDGDDERQNETLNKELSFREE